MNTVAAVIIAFMIIIAFLVGAYSMYRISEHYNRMIREQIRADKDPFFIQSDMKEQPKRPERKPRQKPQIVSESAEAEK